MKKSIIDKIFIQKKIEIELRSKALESGAYPNMEWVIQDTLDVLYLTTIIYTYGNQSKAAKLLGLSRSVYTRRLKKALDRQNKK